MRDLVRAREAAVKDRTRKRQEIRSFLLRHGKIYPGDVGAGFVELAVVARTVVKRRRLTPRHPRESIRCYADRRPIRPLS